jgi:hypothetical protein
LAALDRVGKIHDESPLRVEWEIDGVLIAASGEVISGNEGEPLLVVSLDAEIARIPSAELGLEIADRMGAHYPLGVVFWKEGALRSRVVLSLSSTGRSMLTVVPVAALMLVDRCNNSRMLLESLKTAHPGITLDVPSWTSSDLSGGFVRNRLAIGIDDGSWFPERWGRIQRKVTEMMVGLGWRPGWSSTEVQYFNLPDGSYLPDIAVALLSPPDRQFSKFGVGITLHARLLHTFGLSSEQAAEMRRACEPLAGECNQWMASVKLSVLSGFTMEGFEALGFTSRAWVPVGAVVSEDMTDNESVVALTNLINHFVSAPLAAHYTLKASNG